MRYSAEHNSQKLRLGKRDDEIVRFLFEARYATGAQIGEACFQTVSERYRPRAVWRRMSQLAAHDFVRVIEQPVYRREREGSKPFIYTLAARGGERTAALFGIPVRQIDVRPKPRERNISYMEHDLGIVEYWLALRRACEQSGVQLQSWVKDHLLLKDPDRVEIVDEDGSKHPYGLVADGCYGMGIGKRTAHCFLEYDRATVTVKASDWTSRSWHSKIRGYLALADSSRLKDRYDADALWVMIVVEGGDQRMQNLFKAAEAVASERAHHFWFTTTSLIEEYNLLTDPIWHVPTKGSRRHSVL